MKILTFIFCFCLSLIGCKKKTAATHIADHSTTAPPPYDTVAIDSFAPGATPAGVSAAFDTMRRVAKKDSLIPIAKEDLTKKERAKKDKQKTASPKKKDSL